MIKLQSICLLLISIFLVQACDDESSNTPVSPFADCCTTSGEFTVANRNVYVPTIFTPNFDGINDKLIPLVEAENGPIAEITSFLIRSTGGDTLFESFNLPLNNFTSGWDGTIGNTDVLYSGKAFYTISFALSSGQEELINGQVCSLPCDNPDISYPVFDSILNCQYGVQHDGAGGFDENLPNFEDLECLEQ